MNTIMETSTHKIMSEGDIIKDDRIKYNIQSLTLSVNSNTASKSISGDYVANIGDEVSIFATMQDAEQINYPGAIMKLPIVRYADDKPTDDEIYWNATIENGLMTASGTFPRSGDWKFSVNRINQALQRSGIEWKIQYNDVSILI